ncbi:MAG: hypothetical protein AB7L36_10835 [Sphingomonadaceae bacterium]
MTQRLRRHWSKTRLVWRGDSYYGRVEVMDRAEGVSGTLPLAQAFANEFRRLYHRLTQGCVFNNPALYPLALEAKVFA